MYNYTIFNTIISRRIAMALCVILSIAMFDSVSAQKATFIDINGNVLDVGKPVHEDDSLAMVALYNATDGPNWRNNSGWLQPGQMVEHWYGIERVEEVNDGEWRITRLLIEENNLFGEFPEELENLQYLERFRLARNYIHGPFPVALTKIPTLQRIIFHYNFVEGPIPWKELSEMPNLERIEVNSNRLTGGFGPEIGDFPRLERLRIYRNRLEGTIPVEVGNVQTLQRLEIGENMFTGDLPSEIGNLSELQILDLRELYGLTPGPIPDWLENLAETLETLYMPGTNRTGQIPAWMNNMFALEYLWLGRGDEIGGEIPDLTFLDNLFHLELRNAQFSGEIPAWLANMPNLERLTLRDNAFTGQIPANFGDGNFRRVDFRNLQLDGPLPDLRNLELQRLRLENLGFEIDEIPAWIGQLSGLEELELPNMGLTGEIPEFLGNLSSLDRLNFEDNAITGEIPAWLENKTTLERLNLNRTNIEISEIPAWLSNREDLDMLQLAGLGLTGQIPSWLSDKDQMVALVLDDNELTGPIPAEFGNFIFLDSLNLANNNFSGTLPTELNYMGRIGQITSLQAVVLSGNEDLTGDIPVEFTNWDPDEVRVFEYDGTGLSGEAIDGWLVQVSEAWNPLNPHIYTSVKRSDTETSIDEIIERPYSFSLQQNYPNPFNPTTTINYEIPNESFVRLSVYNVLGQRVASLVNEHKNSGRYDVNFDATRLASGVYIYRLEADGRVLTNTMMLIK